MDASMSGGRSDAFLASIGEEAARLWVELPVRVDWSAVAAQCAWLWARACGGAGGAGAGVPVAGDDGDDPR
jgi:hypothetical protein